LPGSCDFAVVDGSSPARSTRVLRFVGGSGTVDDLVSIVYLNYFPSKTSFTNIL
jgi:hypothetical protein